MMKRISLTVLFFLGVIPSMFAKYNEVVPVRDGQYVNGYVLTHTWNYYTIEVEQNQILDVQVSGLSDDVDLYVDFDRKPTEYDFKCKSTSRLYGPEECRLKSTRSGTWYIGVYGYHAGSYDMIPSITTIDDNIKVLENGDHIGDYLNYKEWKDYKIFVPANTLLEVRMANISGKIEFFARKGQTPTPQEFDCQARTEDNREKVCLVQSEEAIDWYIGAYSKSGASFTLKTVFQDK